MLFACKAHCPPVSFFRFTHRMGRRIYVRRSPLLYQVSWRFGSWWKEDISLSLASLTAAVISDRRPLSLTHTHTHTHTHTLMPYHFQKCSRSRSHTEGTHESLELFPTPVYEKSNYREVTEGLTGTVWFRALNRLNLLVSTEWIMLTLVVQL